MAKGVPETHPEERGKLNISPRANWVDKAGGLPAYINSVAVALVRGGMPRERAIPTAVNVVKKTCATGHWGGRPNAPVSAAIRGAACKAAAEWEAKKKAANLSDVSDRRAIDLASFDPAKHPRAKDGKFSVIERLISRVDKLGVAKSARVGKGKRIDRLASSGSRQFRVQHSAHYTHHATAREAVHAALRSAAIKMAADRGAVVDLATPKMRRTGATVVGRSRSHAASDRTVLAKRILKSLRADPRFKNVPASRLRRAAAQGAVRAESRRQARQALGTQDVRHATAAQRKAFSSTGLLPGGKRKPGTTVSHTLSRGPRKGQTITVRLDKSGRWHEVKQQARTRTVKV